MKNMSNPKKDSQAIPEEGDILTRLEKLSRRVDGIYAMQDQDEKKRLQENILVRVQRLLDGLCYNLL